ncbi:ion transporter [Solicola gregarius]|uniref:Ion transporter n=1 Tax=Solicola gregarius TaxID=2908642 RepID=A0AA46TGC6_9ACTN|nr:ion transporter [Solicola gregarius]UYM04750.1 ion transporter [Solicola gregarius]
MRLRTRLRQLTVVDVLMIVLAFVSVGLLLYADYGDVDEQEYQRLVIVDVSICAVFAIEFLWRWRRAGWRRSFFWRNWFEILGMIPLSYPALRSFRLLRVVVIVARLARLTDRTAGTPLSERLLSKALSPVVEQIKHPITLAVLEEVSEVLRAGQYNHNVARALEENRDELRAMILEKIKADRRMGRLSILPFHDRVIEASTDTSMRVILAVLEDPRTEELIADVLRENILQIRHDVRELGVAGAAREAESQ